MGKIIEFRNRERFEQEQKDKEIKELLDILNSFDQETIPPDKDKNKISIFIAKNLNK